MIIATNLGLKGVTQLLTLIVVFIIVLFITYYTTRFIGNYQRSNQIGSNIEPIEAYRISNTKYIQIVRIGNKYVAIAVCKDNISYICDVDKEDIVFKDYEPASEPFAKIIEKMKNVSKDSKVNRLSEENNKGKDKINEDNRAD